VWLRSEWRLIYAGGEERRGGRSQRTIWGEGERIKKEREYDEKRLESRYQR
jgi:hypothetical protein